MRILIVEDETTAYENLFEILTQLDPAIKIAGYNESIRQTLHCLQNNPDPDLILMDIHLSDGSAFSIFDSIKIEIPIIFITAYDEYAIDAFKVDSIDYLLKPVKVEDLKRAPDKFKRLTRQDVLQYLSNLAQIIPGPKSKDKILVPVKDKLQPVDLNDVSFFYTSKKNTRIFLKDGISYAYLKTLDQIEVSLNPADFIRANKQFIVARNSIRDITIWFDSRLLITLEIEPPERIYVSKNKAAEFKVWLVRGN
jgi:two-component system response regulator LytT